MITSLRVCLIPGDGAGPEVSAATRRVLDATGVEISWEVHDVGQVAYDRTGEALPSRLVEEIEECGLALKGPVATPRGAPFRSVNVSLRERLDLFLGVRPSRAFPGVPTPFPETDVVVLRMHDGDLYAGIDYKPDDPVATAIRSALVEAGADPLADDTGISVKPISVAAAERAAEAAFAWARDNGRGRVTIVHKANVMRGSDGVFLEAARSVGAGFPELSVDDCLVDRLCADLVRHPGRFDVLFAPMLYGDIASDLTAALCGGLGVAPGANLGDRCAVFEAVHGTVRRHAGQGTANPAALILSGAMLLRHAGAEEAAARVEGAVAAAIAAGAVTADLASDGALPLTTSEMTDAIVERL
ncbi:MAG TPA: isocitrate/isopropylmalate family dehydrogenase [Solirubrobacterales bacterium]|nr:isocitrate/isopropylmalate family dehydrogenase [Solirubrobacterales bacterium]